jgi:hypothetical protein
MKKNSLLVPLLLTAIILVLVIFKALNHSAFKRTPVETLQLAKDSMRCIGSATISKLPAAQLIIIEIGVNKVLPSFPASVEIKSIDFNQLLSAESRSLLSDNKRKKIIYAPSISDASKAWTFLTRMGYNELYILDDEMRSPGENDSIMPGNEALKYSFKAVKVESE